uniref:Secreted protein n=1 Tax=Brassica juncea TaxID=3707 RepID=A0A385FBR2_BRAJU|nr:hypothetical protein [Brassica juncea]
MNQSISLLIGFILFHLGERSEGTKKLDCKERCFSNSTEKAFLESETRGRLGLSMGLALAVRLDFNTSSNSSRRLVDSRNNLLRKKKVHQVLPCHLRRGPISVRLDHCNSRKSIWTSPFSRVTPCLSGVGLCSGGADLRCFIRERIS